MHLLSFQTETSKAGINTVSNRDPACPAQETVAFAHAAAAVIRAKLSPVGRDYDLMLYQRPDGNCLGFHWRDAAGNCIRLTFYRSIDPAPLPSSVEQHNVHIGVGKLTDALLLIQLIADRVQ